MEVEKLTISNNDEIYRCPYLQSYNEKHFDDISGHYKDVKVYAKVGDEYCINKCPFFRALTDKGEYVNCHYAYITKEKEYNKLINKIRRFFHVS